MMIAGLICLVAIHIIILFISARSSRDSVGAGPVVLYIVSPFQETATQAKRFIENLWDHYFFLITVVKENRELKKELARSVAAHSRFEELERANTRLRNLLNFKESIKRRILSAEIIGRDPSFWSKSLFINKGKAAGIRKGMPVVIPEGVTGVVTEASPYYSKVLLIIDPNCAIDAMVKRTRARGVIKGGHSEHCAFQYVLRKDDVAKGDEIISSGLDGVFPKGLKIGRVLEVNTMDRAGVFHDVEVTPFVDFERLEEVMVILDLPDYRFFSDNP